MINLPCCLDTRCRKQQIREKPQPCKAGMGESEVRKLTTMREKSKTISNSFFSSVKVSSYVLSDLIFLISGRSSAGANCSGTTVFQDIFCSHCKWNRYWFSWRGVSSICAEICGFPTLQGSKYWLQTQSSLRFSCKETFQLLKGFIKKKNAGSATDLSSDLLFPHVSTSNTK